MAVEWHGRTTHNYGGGIEDNVDLPLPTVSGTVPGAQIGDTIFVVGTAVDNFTVTDGRFQRITVLDQPSEGYGEAWVGIATTLDPVSVYFDNRSNNVAGHMSAAVIAVRNKWQPARVASDTGSGTSMALPGLSGTGHGAIVLAVGSGGGGLGWSAPSGYQQANAVGSYFVTATAYVEDDPVSASSSTWTQSAARWAYALVGLGPTTRVIPPLRQLGRRDGLGLMPAKSVLNGRSIQGSLRQHGPGAFL